MEELAKKTTSKTTSDISEDKHEVKKGLSLKEIETEVGINFGVIVAKRSKAYRPVVFALYCRILAIGIVIYFVALLLESSDKIAPAVISNYGAVNIIADALLPAIAFRSLQPLFIITNRALKSGFLYDGQAILSA